MFKVKRDGVLEPGIYRAILEALEEKQTKFGNRAFWKFEELETGAEVVGFTSLSSSTQAKAYRWAFSINPEIGSTKNWGPEDVENRECFLELDVYVDSEGRTKNKIIEVLPIEN